MDQISQARLNSLRTTDTNTWSEDDAAFVRARRSYLTSDEVVKFAEVLTPTTSDASKEPDAPKTYIHVITQEDLDANPGFENDVKVGDEVQIPALIKPLSKMNVEELRSTAAAFFIRLEETDKKADILAKIEAVTAQ
jgi:hypothetical protein